MEVDALPREAAEDVVGLEYPVAARPERLALKDKVALEKDRLMKRSGRDAKMYRENAPDTSMGLTVPKANAAGFLADADRFHSDVAGEEYVKRVQKHQQKRW